MYTLYLDTHDKSVVVIILKEGKIVVKKEIVSANKHSQITMPTLTEALNETQIEVNDLNNIIVVNGPGSFTGERISVTIAKTIAYALKIEIRTIDSLSVLAINDNREHKYISLEDRNGAFVGEFDKDNKIIKDIVYMNKSSYEEYKKTHDVISELDIDYEKVYEYVMNNRNALNPHEVKPLYIKGISVLNDK